MEVELCVWRERERERERAVTAPSKTEREVVRRSKGLLLSAAMRGVLAVTIAPLLLPVLPVGVVLSLGGVRMDLGLAPTWPGVSSGDTCTHHMSHRYPLDIS